MKRQSKPDWRKVAEALAVAIPRSRLHPAVLGWCDSSTRSRIPWRVALSGGADSIALLLLVRQHWPERRSRLEALHFNHRLRGVAAKADAEFCRRLCRSLGIRLTVGEWRRLRGSDKPSEAEARTARMAFFSRKARVLWLGHHQDDVAETMLMRLARGSGVAGLSAPRPVQVMSRGRIHLRPLLTIRKTEIKTALKAAGAIWREDASNDTDDFFRNRIRRRVMPAWLAAAQRDAVAGAAHSRDLLAEDDEALERWVDRIAAILPGGDLSLRRLSGAPRAVVRRALHRWILTCRPEIDISRQAFESLLRALEVGKPTRHSLGSKVFATIRGRRLVLESRRASGKIPRRVN